MSTLDTGSACSRYNIYGQMVYWDVTPWTISLEYARLLFNEDEAIYYAKWMISLDVITTMFLSITGTLTCYIQVILPGQFLHRMSLSSMCVYNQHNASLQSTYLIMLVPLVTIFFLWHTCVMSCHVLYYNMPLYNLACYCMVCYCINVRVLIYS